MKSTLKTIIIFILLSVIFTACNKTKVNTPNTLRSSSIISEDGIYLPSRYTLP
jgi:hypothetical protein